MNNAMAAWGGSARASSEESVVAASLAADEDFGMARPDRSAQ